MTTGWRVWKTCCMPAMTRLPSTANSGPRWSIVGRLIARRIRSGTGLGPGICRKWRPLGCWSRGIMDEAPFNRQFCMQRALVKAKFLQLHGLVRLALLHTKIAHGRDHCHPAPACSTTRSATRLRQLHRRGRDRARRQAERARADRAAAGLAHAAARGDQDAGCRGPGRACCRTAARSPRSFRRRDVADTFEVMAGLEGQSGELAAQRISDGELSEIRALHYEMLAALHAARPADLLPAQRDDPQPDQRRGAQPGADAHLAHRQRAPAGAALPLQLRRIEVVARGQEHERMIELLAARDGARLRKLLIAAPRAQARCRPRLARTATEAAPTAQSRP